jgi:hypothetical protein
MFGTGTGNPSGKNFTPFGDKPSQGLGILIIHSEILYTELANFPAEKSLSTPASHAASIASVSAAITAAIATVTSHGPAGAIAPGGVISFLIFVRRHHFLLN